MAPKTTKAAPRMNAKSVAKKNIKPAAKFSNTRLYDLLSSRPDHSPYLDPSKCQKAASKTTQNKSRASTSNRTEGKDPITIGSQSNPITLRSPTTYAARKRNRATLSRAEIFAASRKAGDDSDPEHKDKKPFDHAATFAPDSTAHLTWGVPSTKPVIAVGKRRKNNGPRGSGRGRSGKGRQSANDIFMFGKKPGKDEINEGIDVSKCYFLKRLPLELRWKIYGHILIHEKPIPVHHDWNYVHMRGPINHALLHVNNKQIMVETHNFLYRENVFRALVRPKPTLKNIIDNHGFIQKSYLPLFKNVILENRKENFGPDWIKTVAGSIQRLVECGAILDSLTMVITPERIGPTQTLLGAEISPVSFADFFFTGPVSLRAPSDIMIALSELRLKVLHIILRLPDRLQQSSNGKSRALISMDMRALPVNQVMDGWLSMEEANMEARRDKAVKLSEELRNLKGRIENLVDDADRAVEEGKARWLEEGEGVGGGLKL